MSTGWIKAWIAVGLLAASAANAETLYQRDGITLEGTVRMVTRGAAVCHVLEESEPAAVYERMKANEGQPLHVWRVEFAARNGSGKKLEQLTANFAIASEWPPCTNWSGVQGGYPKTVQWANSFEFVQKPYGLEPDEEVRDAVYVLAFHDQQPRFENWTVDYRFAAGPAAVPAGAAVPSVRESGPDAGQLPPEIQADLYLREAEQAVREGDSAAAREALERVVALQAEHGREPTAEDHYRYAQAWEAAGEPQRALEAAVRYLQLRGREAEHYAEALDLVSRAQAGRPPPAAGNAAAGRVGPGESAGTSAVEEPRAGEPRVFDGMEFVWVPAGEFRMGSTSSEAVDWEQPVTRVRISRGFWLGQHEVRQAEWQAVMGTNPSRFSGCGSCPVERVSWDDAQGFIRRLNERDGKVRYRLPTEAEWEYAARAGTSGDHYGGDLNAIAWYDDNSGFRTQPVGQKAPNAWGLHDMLGNVSEWVQDWYGYYPGGSVTDPQGPGPGSRRVSRGGSWFSFAGLCRAPFREGFPPGVRIFDLGFRLLRIAP